MHPCSGRTNGGIELCSSSELLSGVQSANGGIDYATGMAAMHAVTNRGQVLTGVPVFRRAYEAVGLGWWVAVTRLRIVSWLADRLYDVFAKYRTRWTRGTTVEELVRVYEEKRRLAPEASCETGTCRIPVEDTPTSTM